LFEFVDLNYSHGFFSKYNCVFNSDLPCNAVMFSSQINETRYSYFVQVSFVYVGEVYVTI